MAVCLFRNSPQLDRPEEASGEPFNLHGQQTKPRTNLQLVFGLEIRLVHKDLEIFLLQEPGRRRSLKETE